MGNSDLEKRKKEYRYVINLRNTKPFTMQLIYSIVKPRRKTRKIMEIEMKHSNHDLYHVSVLPTVVVAELPSVFPAVMAGELPTVVADFDTE